MEERNYGSYEPREPGPGPEGRKDFEQKLDEVADKVSQTVSDGVSRLEETVSSMQKRPEVSESKIRDLFTSPPLWLVALHEKEKDGHLSRDDEFLSANLIAG
jgi:hypothetical protein